MAKKPALFGRCGSLIWTIAFCNLVKLKLTLLLIPYGNLKWQNLVFFSYCCSVNFHSVTMVFFPFNCVKPRSVVLPTWQLKVAKRAHFGCCWINFNLPLMFAGACNFFCRQFFYLQLFKVKLLLLLMPAWHFLGNSTQILRDICRQQPAKIFFAFLNFSDNFDHKSLVPLKNWVTLP